MTTRLELARCYQSKHSLRIEKEREVIAELPDEKGVYDTTVGKIGLDFGSTLHKTGTSDEVLLDVSQAKALQSRQHRKVRRVEIGTTHLINNHTVLFAHSDIRDRKKFANNIQVKYRK